MTLRVEKLSVTYGRVPALREVSLSVEPGEVVSLIGSNGAGKTTLLNAICGIVPSRGTISWKGRRIAGLPTYKIVQMGLSYVPEGRQIFGSMSVLDNLTLGGYGQCQGRLTELLGPAHRFLQRDGIRASLDRVYELFPILRERQAQLGGSLSGGEQQMLAMGRALMASPEILLLDEPSMGLAPTLVREIISLLGRLRERGLTVLLVEQNAAAALKIADRGYVLERGRIVIEGSSSELLGNPRVRQAYLGKTRAEASP